MWINREILQKVLQLNRREIIFLISLFTAVCFVPLYGENQLPADIAILEKGPVGTEGIELLDTNTIPGFTGIYRFDDQNLKVIYTEYSLPVLRAWKKTKYSGYIIYRIPQDAFTAWYYSDQRGYSLFFEFPVGFRFSFEFIKGFIDKFNIFLGFVKYKIDIPFPAIVQLKL